MGYLEEIYERAERKFITDTAKLAWLSSFERPSRGANDYTKAGVRVRDELISFEDIKNNVKRAKNLREVKKFEEEANDIYFDDLRSEALGLVNQRVQVLEGEAEEEKKRFKEAELRKEREEAQRKLRELSPQKLGGIKSGETRRGKIVLRNFGEEF